MAAVQLTTGAVAAMSEHAAEEGSLKPVLQVVDVWRVSVNANAAKRFVAMLLSDGVHTMKSMVTATAENYRVRDGAIVKGTIIRPQEFSCMSIQFRRIVVIIKLDVLQSDCPIIGSPVAYKSRNLPKEQCSNLPAAAAQTYGGTYSGGPEMGGVPEYDKFEKMLENILLNPRPTPVSLSLEFLEAITDGFSRELGRGTYGVVYKGFLRSGNFIAVKKIFDKHLVEDCNQFQNEITNLVGRKHQNIVQLVGYCVESRSRLVRIPSGKHVMAEVLNMLLCFEYISNRSLYDHVSDEFSGFDWDTRYEIIKGIGSGLHFLHEICHIVHLDLKPQNILMDGSMIPKIADFGLSRLLGEQKTRTIINGDPAGTLGYMAPEYLLRGEVSTKADIFSFGIIIIQIITGRRDHPQSTVLYSNYAAEDNSLQSIETSIQHYTENVLQRWKRRFETSTRSSPQICIQQVEKCITLALNCVNNDLKKRPTAGEIIQMLNAVES